MCCKMHFSCYLSVFFFLFLFTVCIYWYMHPLQGLQQQELPKARIAQIS